MLCSFTTRFRNFIWFLIFTFTLYCMPNYDLLFPYEIHIGWNEAYASENNSEDTSKAISSDQSTTKEGVSADKESTENKVPEECPVLGRFISPDRLVPYPGNLQAFNRYSYCINNPLIYTDPSGEWFWIIGIIISVILGSTQGAYQAKRSGENVYKGAMIGGIRALISYNIVGAIVDSSMAGAIQAHKAGENPWAGAMLGGSVAAVSSYVSKGVGGLPGASAAGGFSSLVNAAAYGGNVWKAALYGGLTSVAIAGTVQGAIALGESISNYSNTTNEEAIYAKGRAPTPEERAWIEEVFPNLKGEKFTITGEPTPFGGDVPAYNCIAWSLNRTDGWVNPTSTVTGMDELYANPLLSKITEKSIIAP